MALTPDFDTYPIDVALMMADVQPAWVATTWADGRVSRFHHMWLRDNCPCGLCVRDGTREQTFELVSISPDIHATSAVIDGNGSLVVEWSPDGVPAEAHRSEFHPGWLRRHAYDDESRRERSRAAARVTWDGQSLREPPTFDGAAIMVDDGALHEWLSAIHTLGVSRVQNVPCETDAIADLVARVGLVRETNFGVLWDVKSEPNPITNANTSLPLPPHVDLATREYQPGLQFLHCIINETEGGDNILVDGFRIAEIIRDEHPADYEILTTVPFEWANRSMTSDYRWRSPQIVTNDDGSLKEVRVGNWLRAPLDVPFDMVEACYRAYRRLFELTYREDLQLRFRLAPGEVMAFDNRRALHARGEFTDTSGRRFLRGCYSERDDLYSKIRIIERGMRERRVAAENTQPSASRSASR